MTKLCPPELRSPLLLYVSASNSAVSAVLVQEKEEEGKLKQIPVYFASEALSGSKNFYSELEKIAYAVIMAVRKLRHYFEGHRIRVITNQPLSDLFANREASTRIIKWGAELSEYAVDFERRSAIKSQVLAYFVVDWTSPTQNLDEKIPEPWIVQCDGAWCYKGVGISAVVTSLAGVVIRYAAWLIFANNEHSTNNTTEYESLLLALRKMKTLGQQTFIIRTDLKVIQEHVEKESEARNPVLMKYLEKVREMERYFKGYSVQDIPRDDNNEADKLAKAAVRNQELPPDVFFEIIREPSIKDLRSKIVNVVETPDWRAEIMAYLIGHYEPQEELEEKRLKQRARGYTVVNGELYKSGVTEPWLRCITSEKDLELLKEIHSGFCGAHIGTRALAGKAIKQGFYWPTINIDAKTLVRQCEACQKTTNQQNLPSMPVHLIPPSWPLQRWGMDLVGPLPTAQGNCRFVAVAVDYFTKWVEAKPLANIKAPTIQKFFWQNIVCKFGVPRELTVDNGKQFDCYTFKEYCKTLGTHAKFSLVYHSQSNGAVERANVLIFFGNQEVLIRPKEG
jgi:ribonuclease HI